MNVKMIGLLMTIIAAISIGAVVFFVQTSIPRTTTTTTTPSPKTQTETLTVSSRFVNFTDTTANLTATGNAQIVSYTIGRGYTTMNGQVEFSYPNETVTTSTTTQVSGIARITVTYTPGFTAGYEYAIRFTTETGIAVTVGVVR